jgi:hypothetical protein
MENRSVHLGPAQNNRTAPRHYRHRSPTLSILHSSEPPPLLLLHFTAPSRPPPLSLLWFIEKMPSSPRSLLSLILASSSTPKCRSNAVHFGDAILSVPGTCYRRPHRISDRMPMPHRCSVSPAPSLFPAKLTMSSPSPLLP